MVPLPWRLRLACLSLAWLGAYANDVATVFVYDHTNIKSWGISQQYRAAYARIFQNGRRKLSRTYTSEELEFYVIAKEARQTMAKSKMYLLTDSPDDAELILVAVWETGLCDAIAEVQASKSQSSEFAQARPTGAAPMCPELRRVYDWMTRTSRFKLNGGRDYVLLVEQLALKVASESVPAAMMLNSIFLGIEETRPESEIGCSRIALAPPYVRTPRDSDLAPPRDHFLSWLGGQHLHHPGVRNGTHAHSDGAIFNHAVPLPPEHAPADTLLQHSRVIRTPLGDHNSRTHAMARSVYCLVSRGDSSASSAGSRFFAAIMSGCVPVVIADRIHFPFADRVDWDEFVVRMPETAVRKGSLDFVISELGYIDAERLGVMQTVLNESRQHISYDPPSGNALKNVLHTLVDQLQTECNAKVQKGVNKKVAKITMARDKSLRKSQRTH